MLPNTKLLLLASAITLLMALAGWLIGTLSQPHEPSSASAPSTPLLPTPETPHAPATLVANLKADWSSTANPNPQPAGTWSLNLDNTPLDSVASWFALPGISGWGSSINGPRNNLPFIFQATIDGSPGDPNGSDFKAGDILIHANDPTNGPPAGDAVVAWTASTSGSLAIAASLWPIRKIGRDNTFQMLLLSNGSSKPLTSGTIPEDSTFSRANPAHLTLRLSRIKKGDTLQFILARNPNGVADFTALDLTYTLTTESLPPSSPQFTPLSSTTRPLAHTLDSSSYALPALILSILALVIATFALMGVILLFRRETRINRA